MTTSITLLHYVVTNSNKYLLLTHVDTRQEREKRMKIATRSSQVRRNGNNFPQINPTFILKTILARYTYTPHATCGKKNGIQMQSEITVKSKNINEICSIPAGIPTADKKIEILQKNNALASIQHFRVFLDIQVYLKSQRRAYEKHKEH